MQKGIQVGTGDTVVYRDPKDGRSVGKVISKHGSDVAIIRDGLVATVYEFDVLKVLEYAE